MLTSRGNELCQGTIQAYGKAEKLRGKEQQTYKDCRGNRGIG